MKKTLSLVLCAVICLALFSACGDTVIGAPASSGESVEDAGGTITLTGTGASFSCGGVSVTGNTVSINAAGEYTLTGSLDNGEILIDTGDEALDVTLVLDSVTVTNTTAAALYVVQAKNVYLVLPAGSSSSFTTGTPADVEKYNDLSSGAAILSEDDLKISGSGTLTVNGYVNNAITCKDDLSIEGGTINLTAAGNGLRGSESVSISGGSVNVTAGNDGIKSTSADKEGKGYVAISGGEVTIASVGDGISAETSLEISGGTVSVTTSGNPDAVSCKGLKGKTGISLSGGEVTINAADHAVHSAAGVSLSGVSLNLSSAAKGIAAHSDIAVTGGNINISSGKEGIETVGDISISDGSITVSAGEDGIRSGEKGNGFTADTGVITITGGTIRISALCDPLDAKSAMYIDAGTVIGTGLDNSPKDFSSASSQASICCSISGAAGSEISVSGIEGASITALYDFNYLIFSSSALTADTTYSVLCGAAEISAVA